MKYILGLLIMFAAFFVIAVGVIFGYRIYHSFEYGWNEETPVNHHRYSQYEVDGDFTTDHFRSGLSNGIHLVPDENQELEPIVLFGDRGGDINFEMATDLANSGYEVYALFYFGGDQLPNYVDRIPLEFFNDFLVAQELEDTELTVIGTGKGAELGLLLTNYYDNIEHLVLYAPSTHVFSGWDLTLDVESSWTYNEEIIPFVNLRDSDWVTLGRTLLNRSILYPTEFRPLYEAALESENHEDARIGTSNFDGRALIFAGDDDKYWPGDVFARELGMTLDNAEVNVYPNAGHRFSAKFMENGVNYGGTEEGNLDAKEESTARLLEFLENR